MKKILLFLLILFTTTSCVFAKNSINVDYQNGIYHIILSGDKIKKKIQFVSSSKLITNKEAHNNSESILTINAGFFDPKNQKAISYIVSDYQIAEDPFFNENFMYLCSLFGGYLSIFS